MDQLTVTLIQCDILWENPTGNLERLKAKLEEFRGKTDIVVLPEMFTTGFSMHSSQLAETVDGPTVGTLKKWAEESGLAFAGSFIASEDDRFYNRGFFITPEETRFYDKRHLFRMSAEPEHFAAGTAPLIVNYKGWNISLQICYDLRFPVWLRNVDNAYDLLLFVASWPKVRQNAWNTLLMARAIENCAWVAGVNRVGTDPNGLVYEGGSVMIDMKGQVIAEATPGKEESVSVTISKSALEKFRERFPTWKDADRFILEDPE